MPDENECVICFEVLKSTCLHRYSIQKCDRCSFKAHLKCIKKGKIRRCPACDKPFRRRSC